MTDHRVVMQMALDTLEGFSPLDVCRDVHHHRNDYHGVLENCPVYERHKQTITDLRAAIAQPEQPAPVRQPLTDKQDRALGEANCNAESDAFFEARPAQDSVENRRMFNAGHRRAWVNYPIVVKPIAQPEQTPDLQHVIETLIDHGHGKYRGAVSKAQRDNAIAICEALEHPANDRNFCPRCGKRLGGVDDVHTCTAPVGEV